jgi:hypothetical protein
VKTIIKEIAVDTVKVMFLVLVPAILFIAGGLLYEGCVKMKKAVNQQPPPQKQVIYFVGWVSSGGSVQVHGSFLFFAHPTNRTVIDDNNQAQQLTVAAAGRTNCSMMSLIPLVPRQ